MNFFKTSIWASISTGVTMLCGLITTKYVAAVIGPAGMAYVGQFGNSTAMIQLFASGAFGIGVVKYISETQDLKRRRDIFATAIFLTLLCTFLAAVFSIVFASYLSRVAFHNTQYYQVYIVFACLLVFTVFNALCSSVLNGAQNVKMQALLNIINAIFNVIFILIGFRFFGIQGVLAATFVSALFVSFIYYRQMKKMGLLPSVPRIFRVNKPIIKLLFGFSAMSIVSGVLAPSIQMIVRGRLMVDSAANAGNWQACTRLSDYYLNFVYAALAMYYLPKLSSLTEKKDLKKEIWSGMAKVIPFVAIASLAIWLLREYVIKFLLTEEFRPMLPLLKVQLMFDVVKIAGAMLAYLLWAKAMRYTHIIVEVVFGITYVLLSWFFINHYGMIGPIYAFGVNQILYFATLVVVFRKILF